MKINFRFSIEIKRDKKDNEGTEKEEHKPEGNNFATVENSYQSGPDELKLGFQRNEWYEDKKS